MTGCFRCLVLLLTLSHIAISEGADKDKNQNCKNTFGTRYSRGSNLHDAVNSFSEELFKSSIPNQCDLPSRFKGSITRSRCSKCERFCDCVKIFASLSSGGSLYNNNDRARCCKDRRKFKLHQLVGCSCNDRKKDNDGDDIVCHCLMP